MAARPQSPRLQLRDLWHLTQELQKEGLLVCLNPDDKTGRLYCWTEWGRELASVAFDRTIEPVPGNVDWRRYSRIARGKARRAVLLELRQPRFDGKQALTTVEIRRSLVKKHPMALNLAIRALQDLCADGLVAISGRTKKRNQKLFRLTETGELIVEQLAR